MDEFEEQMMDKDRYGQEYLLMEKSLEYFSGKETMGVLEVYQRAAFIWGVSQARIDEIQNRAKETISKLKLYREKG